MSVMTSSTAQQQLLPTKTDGFPFIKGPDITRVQDFFKNYKDLEKFATPFENQTNYPSRLNREIKVYIKDFLERMTLILREKMDRWFPIEMTDVTEKMSLIMEVNPNIARRSALRAPKHDLQGIGWKALMSSMKLYAVGATVVQNYGDDGGFGEMSIRLQMKAQMDGMIAASNISAWIRLTMQFPNPYYAKKAYTHDPRTNFIDDMWEREAFYFDVSSVKDALNKIESRRQKELERYSGQARTLIITENMQNWLTLYQESNIEKGRIGEMADGARNKSEGNMPITTIGHNGTTVETLPDLLLPDGLYWEPLQTYTTRGNAYRVGRRRNDLDYKDYESMHDTIRVTNSDEKKLGEITVAMCLANSYLYRGATGIQYPGGAAGDLAPQAYYHEGLPITLPKDDGDLFWNANGLPATPYYLHPLRGLDTNDYKRVIDIGQALHTYVLESNGYNHSQERHLWSFLKEFRARKLAENVTTAQVNMITKGNVNGTGLDRPRKNGFYDLDGVENMYGIFSSFRGLDAWAYSAGEANGMKSDKESLKAWVTMIKKITSTLEELFPNSAYLKSVVPLTLGGGNGIAVPREEGWLRLTGVGGFGPTVTYYTETGGVNPTQLVYETGRGFEGTHAGILGIETVGSAVYTFPVPYFGVDWPVIRDTIDTHKESNSTMTHVLKTYLTATNNESTSRRLQEAGVPLTWDFLFIQPIKQYIGESIIAIEPALTMTRLMAFPEKRMGKSFDGTNYKFFYQAMFGESPGIPEYFGTYDNVHIVKYLRGDTIVPTKWTADKSAITDKRTANQYTMGVPHAFVVAIPLNWQQPKNFADISNETELRSLNRTIPGWSRANLMWGLKSETGISGVLRPYVAKALPNNVADEIQDIPRNWLLDFEPHYTYTKDGRWEKQPGNGTWKDISADFWNERYGSKSLI